MSLAVVFLPASPPLPICPDAHHDSHSVRSHIHQLSILLIQPIAHLQLFQRHCSKPKSARVKRALDEREAKVIENPKTAVFVRGNQISERVSVALKELVSLPFRPTNQLARDRVPRRGVQGPAFSCFPSFLATHDLPLDLDVELPAHMFIDSKFAVCIFQAMLKRPESINFSKKNDVHPFESVESLEFWGSKNDASLFLVGLHSKKRPHDLVFVRMFDGKVLDMIELGIEMAQSMAELKVSKLRLFCSHARQTQNLTLRRRERSDLHGR